MLILALAMTLAAPQAADANENDLKCVAALAIALADANEVQSKSLSYQLSFFLGKLYGRAPDYDLTSNLRRAASAYGAALFKAELPRCAAEFTAKMGEVDRASKALGSQ